MGCHSSYNFRGFYFYLIRNMILKVGPKCFGVLDELSASLVSILRKSASSTSYGQGSPNSHTWKLAKKNKTKACCKLVKL